MRTLRLIGLDQRDEPATHFKRNLAKIVANLPQSRVWNDGWECGAFCASDNISHHAITTPATRSGVLAVPRGMQAENDNVVIVPCKD